MGRKQATIEASNPLGGNVVLPGTALAPWVVWDMDWAGYYTRGNEVPPRHAMMQLICT